MTQPNPQPGIGDVTGDLIRFIEERRQKGIATYGRSLQYFNGRSSLQDALEESTDMPQYLLQLKGELANVLEILERSNETYESNAISIAIKRLRTIIGAA